MLVLSRKEGEKIMIGNRVEVTVTQIGKGRVRLGIVAPESVHIRRGELPDWSSDQLADAGPARIAEETCGRC
jgi:carbon storage regulator